MKKVLISDYDGTIYQDDITTKENIKAINRFRKNNIFAVATVIKIFRLHIKSII